MPAKTTIITTHDGRNYPDNFHGYKARVENYRADCQRKEKAEMRKEKAEIDAMRERLLARSGD